MIFYLQPGWFICLANALTKQDQIVAILLLTVLILSALGFGTPV